MQPQMHTSKRRSKRIPNDRNIRHSSTDELLRALREVELYDKRAGHVIEATKTVAWSTCLDQRTYLADLRIDGVPIAIVGVLER